LISEGPWFQWHYDAFELPPGATLVADTEVGVQAFVAGRCLGLQCHPEVTPEIVSGWALASSNELAREGLDAHTLVGETRRQQVESRRSAWRLLDRFRDRIVRTTDVANRP
jgi:GMP synthase-like glutamine amidotransferase